MNEHSSRKCSGAILLETVFMFPIVLVSLLMMIWAALTVHAQISLSSAMINGLRLAATRGVVERAGSLLIPDLEDFVVGTETEAIKGLLMSDPEGDWEEAKAIYDGWAQENFSLDFNKLPLEWIQAVIYVQESMRISVGRSVKYPCDPNAAGSAGVDCLLCQIVSGQSLDPGVDPESSDSGRIALACSYQPNNAVLDFFLKIMSTLTGNAESRKIVFSRKTFIDLPKAPWEREEME